MIDHACWSSSLIFLNGMLLGTGGAFNPYVSPSPAPTASPSAPSSSASPAVSAPAVGPELAGRVGFAGRGLARAVGFRLGAAAPSASPSP